LDSPIVIGRLALEAGEETKRLWLTSLCSPAVPEARDESTSDVELASDLLLPTLLLSALDFLPPCSPVSVLWLGVFGLEDQMVLEPPRQPGETRDLSFSAIFWTEVTFESSFSPSQLPSAGTSL
jgi:hypothetical protein